MVIGSETHIKIELYREPLTLALAGNVRQPGQYL